MKSKVLDNIIKYNLINSETTVIAGVSGGYDSMVMLDILKDYSAAIGFEIIVAHVNHMHRGTEADGDEEHVRAYAGEHGLKFESIRKSMDDYAAEHSISPEDAGRRIRYEFFNSLASAHPNSVIAVAHNLDDQAETVLLNLIRGSGLRGLTGMTFKSENIIRPLLNISRAEIEAFAGEQGIAHREDRTNTENVYRRNSIRNQLIPFIEREYNPEFTKTVFRMSEILQDQEEIINSATGAALDGILISSQDDKYVVNKAGFNKLEKSIRNNIIRSIITDLLGSVDGFDKTHIDQFTATALRPSGKKMSIGGIKLSVVYEHIIIEIKKSVEEETSKSEIMIDTDKFGVYKFGKWEIEAEHFPKTKSRYKEKRDIVYLDADKLDSKLVVRTRRPGDTMSPLGMDGTKKIKNLMIDMKVEPGERENIPIITTQSGDIIWVSMLRRSNKYVVTEQTQNILALKVRGANL